MFNRKITRLRTLALAAAAAACGPATAGEHVEIPAQTSLRVELAQTLHSDRNGAGDAFAASLQEPVYGPDGETLIPAGASVLGTITRIQEDPPEIQLQFEAIVVRGERQPIQAELASVTPRRHSEMKDEGAKIGGGAAAGAILGGVVGGNAKGALIGGAAGAAAGTGVALATKDTHVFLPAGSLMELRLTKSIQVERPADPGSGSGTTD
ncbi:MAG: hypothetical protein RRA92_10890 [Gemmatimonadota bacterium]|nr:hypothetical protein [Gemmatimonadota bacterium]